MQKLIGYFNRESKCILILCAVLIIVHSCKTQEVDYPDDPSIDEYEFIDIDIRKVSNAEKIIVGRDGSYVILNSNAQRGPVFLQFNTSDSVIPDGITVIMDDNYLPQFALFDGYKVFFGSVSEDTVDFIVEDLDGHQYCYWDMPLENVDMDLSASQVNLILQTRSLIGGPEADAAYLLVLRCMSLSLQTLLMGSGTNTVLNFAGKVALKSLFQKVLLSIIESSAIKHSPYHDGFEVWGVSFTTSTKQQDGTILLSRLDNWIQQQYDNLSKERVFDENKEFNEYYIRLTPEDKYSHGDSNFIVINCGPSEGLYYVDINTKSNWWFEDEDGEEWFKPFKNTANRIGVYIKENKTANTRRAIINIVTPGREGASNASMFRGAILLSQSGSDDYLKLSNRSLLFPKQGGQQRIDIVKKSDDVAYWYVWGEPSWCTINPVYEEDFLPYRLTDFEKNAKNHSSFMFRPRASQCLILPLIIPIIACL